MNTVKAEAEAFAPKAEDTVLFFRLSDKKAAAEFHSFIKLKDVELVDKISVQLKELIEIRNPSLKLSMMDYEQKEQEILDGKTAFEFGVWVYYPWMNKAIHLLDEEEFIEVRTNRNLYKITPSERDTFRNKKIGVIGLSVGQSSAIALITERLCGEIRIADFDSLELSNLNRIATGVQFIGVSKVSITARRIKEIDPFIKIKCFYSGITESNIKNFLTDKTGKIDVLVEECDSLNVKVLARTESKKYQIPVVMETSDRGMLDIERFDKEPKRPLFHDKIGDVNYKSLKGLSTDEKIAFVAPLLGIEDMSLRIKTSMLEIDQTLKSWPQLASSVILGSALVSTTIRNLFLGKSIPSGRHYFDLEEQLINPSNISQNERNKINRNEPSEKTVEDILTQLDLNVEDSEPLNDDVKNKILQAACRAPSAGNSQPWRWKFYRNHLIQFFDNSRITSSKEFDYLSVGAAVQNAQLQAFSSGYQCKIFTLPLEGNDPTCVISFQEKKDKISEAFLNHNLHHEIFKRRSNRERKSQAIDHKHLEFIKDLGDSFEGVNTKIISDKNLIGSILEILAETDKIRFTNPQMHEEIFEHEISWNNKQSTGIRLSELDLLPHEEEGFKIARDWNVISELKKIGGGDGFKKLLLNIAEATPALGFIVINQNSPKYYFSAGRAMELAWLAAEKRKVSFHPIGSGVPIFKMLWSRDKEQLLNPASKVKISELFQKFQGLIPFDGKYIAFIFRLFKSNQDNSISSQRLPVSEVLI